MFTLNIVLEERDESGELLSYNKHEIADPYEAFSLVARFRLREDVDPAWREAGRRARAFFLGRARTRR